MASYSELMQQSKKRADVWSEREIDGLLCSWKPKVNELKHTKRNCRVYHAIAVNLSEKYGINRSVVEVRNKINNLTKQYRRIRFGREPYRGQTASTWKYWAPMHSMLGNLTSLKPNNIVKEEISKEGGECRFNKSGIAAKCRGCVYVPSGNEEALKVMVATVGPIATYVDASSFGFQLYSGGIYDDPNCSSTMLDHSMLIIGYGTEEGKDYWLLQNSWGASWGINGFIKMSRSKNNQCGIATEPTYPLLV